MPGSGKSTIGRRLARHLALPFIDCDAEIESRAGATIASLFETSGEAAFRDLESDVLAAVLGGPPALVATGGGAVLREENRRLLRERSTVVFLDATPAQLGRRVRPDGKRPLLAGADVLERLARLHAERDPLYREVAALTVQPGTRRPDEVARSIAAGLERMSAHA